MNETIQTELAAARALMRSETPWLAFPHLYAAQIAYPLDKSDDRAIAAMTLREFERGCSYSTLLRTVQWLHKNDGTQNRFHMRKLIDLALKRCPQPGKERDEVLRVIIDVLTDRARATARDKDGGAAIRSLYIEALTVAEELSTPDAVLIDTLEQAILHHCGDYMYLGHSVDAEIIERRAAFRLGLKHGRHDQVTRAVPDLLLLYGRKGTIQTQVVALYRQCRAAYDPHCEISRETRVYLEMLAAWSIRMNEPDMAAHLYERLVKEYEALSWPWDGPHHHPWDLFILPRLMLCQVDALLRLYAANGGPSRLADARAAIEKLVAYMGNTGARNSYMGAWRQMSHWMFTRTSFHNDLCERQERQRARRHAADLRRALAAVRSTEPSIRQAQNALRKVTAFLCNSFGSRPGSFFFEFNTGKRWHKAIRDRKALPPFTFDDKLADSVTGGQDFVSAKLKSALSVLKLIDRGSRQDSTFRWAQSDMNEAMQICHARMFGACLLSAWLASERCTPEGRAQADRLIEEAQQHKEQSGSAWIAEHNQALSLVVRRHRRNKKLVSLLGRYWPTHVCQVK